MNRQRRFGGWGFADTHALPPPEALSALECALGKGEGLPQAALEFFRLPKPRKLPRLPGVLKSDGPTRLAYACGQSFPDLLLVRTAALRHFPDAVAFPASPEEVLALVQQASTQGVVLVPRGGGTSVVGGVNIPQDPRPVVVVSLEKLSGLYSLDGRSGLATLGAGTPGPEVEAQLAANGFWLGHEPQSFELSTIGGWAATRSAGHRSTGLGKMEDLVAGVEVALPAGAWRLGPLPAAAAGPELRRVLCGSEGRLGILTSVTVRVRPRPAKERGKAILFPSWDQGFEFCRWLLREEPFPEVLRLSDAAETSFGRHLVTSGRAASLARDFLFSLRRFSQACLLLVGTTGKASRLVGCWARQARHWGGLPLGSGVYRRWLQERFKHPYLRDSFLSCGFGVDTFETAAPWSQLPRLKEAVRAGLERAAASLGIPILLLCHLSHAYPDGASLYFTFFWPLRREEALSQWQSCKRASLEAILQAGGTISHHHGVGRMHAAYLERELGSQGMHVLKALTQSLDPAGILNPGVLLPEDEV